MKKSISLLLGLMAVMTASAQFDPQMGQYMYLASAYNPAAVGEGNLMKVAGMHRMQYVDITNAPMSTWFGFSSPFVIGKTSHGAGIRFLNDRYGLFTTQSLYAQYAYRHKIGNGYLSAGVDLGFVNVGFKGDSVNLSKMGDDDELNEVQQDIKVGMEFETAIDDVPYILTVIKVDDKGVTVDANHPLAGKALFFDVKVTDIKEALSDELVQGFPMAPEER